MAHLFYLKGWRCAQSGNNRLSLTRRNEEEITSGTPGRSPPERFSRTDGFKPEQARSQIGVPARRINQIVLGKRGVTADTALRLAKFFGMSAQFWTGLQSEYDLDIAVEALGDRIDKEIKTYSKKPFKLSATFNHWG